jgi:hypothetical protein
MRGIKSFGKKQVSYKRRMWMWIAKDDVGEHRLEALDMLVMGFFRGRMERENGWRDALWTFCYDLQRTKD